MNIDEALARPHSAKKIDVRDNVEGRGPVKKKSVTRGIAGAPFWVFLTTPQGGR
jgi:hypothetical protein